MSERLPPSTDPESNPKRDNFGRKIRRSGAQVIFITYLLSTESGREVLKKYGIKDAIFSLEGRTGLLESSILSNTLFYPDDEETSLLSEQSIAGRWVAYDFDRPLEFGKRFKGVTWQKKEGKLWCFPLKEIIDNNPDELTPTNLVDWFEWDHMSQLSAPSIGKLVDLNLVKESTYAGAYASIGLLEKFRRSMESNEILDNKVFVVTPKGNGLVYLAKDSGKPKENPEKAKVLKPKLVFGT